MIFGIIFSAQQLTAYFRHHRRRNAPKPTPPSLQNTPATNLFIALGFYAVAHHCQHARPRPGYKGSAGFRGYPDDPARAVMADYTHAPLQSTRFSTTHVARRLPVTASTNISVRLSLTGAMIVGIL
ncbi:hypothetical protein KCP73_04700 [Salmonella enterica subsp. enterica]|nr:hypothetical protein KCP73_04700 [Salmonella enterica subsp. enterica]